MTCLFIKRKSKFYTPKLLYFQNFEKYFKWWITPADKICIKFLAPKSPAVQTSMQVSWVECRLLTLTLLEKSTIANFLEYIVSNSMLTFFHISGYLESKTFQFLSSATSSPAAGSRYTKPFNSCRLLQVPLLRAADRLSCVH